MHPIKRSSQRLGLRELRKDDAGALFDIYGSAEATEHMSFLPRTVEDVENVLAGCMASALKAVRAEYAVAVIERDSGSMIGFGRLAMDPHQPRAATFGFALRPASWGVGYGVETVHLLLGLAFEELDLHRVWGARSPLNEASARVMSTAGMVEEGVIREHVQKAGVWRDSVVHSILEREWKGTGPASVR
ncbi:GNAT family N-acetyltransferase [Streptomyces sp. NBC_01506]|uniref:GNAT family N-acetyltransferase n=1 Tax=Streptomyces sp. NBC_01506 TaxID=2903887 RepID=UPI0038672619